MQCQINMNLVYTSPVNTFSSKKFHIIPCHKDHLINDQGVTLAYLHHLIPLTREYDTDSVKNARKRYREKIFLYFVDFLSIIVLDRDSS